MVTAFPLLLVSLAVSLQAASDASVCDQGWASFSGQCYRYFREMKSWAEAEIHCLSLGGHMASVHSSDDNQFVTSLIKGQASSDRPTWLGATKCEETPAWLWTDGSEWHFSNWYSREPNNRHGVEKCLQVNFRVPGSWNDINCASRLPFVCVKD
uniref:Lactose-binding lectin l-2-like n=1 Tax=Erpetoichthys calabaricus TaxID=27687 RepID=A0A8C4T381_ERPCA